jgi:hypothetical protein
MILKEPDRNRILRRADWRFLLPEPIIGTSICFTGGLLAEATAAVSQASLQPDRADIPGRCDVAVAAEPTAATLQRAWTALRPGGALYVEWGGLWAGGPAGIRFRLEAAGFTEIACYAPRPAPWQTVEMWIPLESDGAVRYFLARLDSRGPVLRRLVRQIGKVLWNSSMNLRLGLPLSAVASKPEIAPSERGFRRSRSGSTRDTRGLSPQLQDELLSSWSSWGVGHRPKTLSTLLITRGRRSINKTVALVFAASRNHPLLALKRARVSESAPALLNEAEVLRAVQARPGGMRGAPRVLFCRELDGLLTLAETVIEGRPVTQVLNPQNFRELALRAADWSADLVQSTVPLPPGEWWGRLIEPVLAHFHKSFEPVLDEGAFRAALAILSSLGPLPLLCEQRDYSPWNLIVQPNGELGVLDWESAEPQGLPGLDLIYCLTYLSAYLNGSSRSGDLREARRRCLEPETEVGRVASECLNRYRSRLGLPATALQPLAVLAWMIHARSEYNRFCSDLGKPPDPAILRESIFLQLWSQELEGKALQ